MPYLSGNKLLAKNITAFGDGLRFIILLGTEKSVEMTVPSCQLLLENFDSYSIALPAPVAEQAPLIEGSLPEGASPDNTLFVLCDYDWSVLKSVHAASGFLKSRGFIVTTLNERTLFFGPIQNTANPIHYPIMFNEAGKVAGNLRKGHYMEFGVFDGRTFTIAWHSMAHRCPWMRFFGFDTFAGIRGARADEEYIDGTYFSNRNTFHHHWKVSGLDPARCEAIPGDYRESLMEPGLLDRLGIDAAAVVHIDCDVYEAAKIALNFVAPVLQQGSVLLFDEFHANHASNATGERRALREMLEENPSIEVERWHDYALEGRSFLVHRR